MPLFFLGYLFFFGSVVCDSSWHRDAEEISFPYSDYEASGAAGFKMYSCVFLSEGS